MKFRKLLILIFLLSVVGSFVNAQIILTSDQQLTDLQDPDKKLDLSTGLTKSVASLREVCEDAKARHRNTLTIAFDEFFRQYRDQEGTDRKLTPDLDEYIAKIKTISDFAKTYGLGLQLSVLNPLEIGPGFAKATGDYGRWVRYTVGLREPSSGKFDVQLWRELYWTNNKGKIELKLKGVKVYAFREKEINRSTYSVVLPEDIIELTHNIQYEEWPDEVAVPEWIPTSIKHDVEVPIKRVSVYSNGSEELKGYDRVFVMLEYEVPEMDYFSPEAAPFLKDVMRKYYETGVNLTHLYSDEMHIQQDWHYHNHHENGQFSNRYLTDNFAKAYSEKYGDEYRDMDKYMLYFMYGPRSYNRTPFAVLNTQYVMGDTPEAIAKTILFRDRYYKMLNNQVVDIFKEAKEYAEELYGRELPTHAHASWAESPTIDLVNTEKLFKQAYLYEYTSNFLWANTVQQASAACYDYFKWGEYLQPTGNDFAECGWSDRDYYGAALAASIGILNIYPSAYAAYWGMPRIVEKWKGSINSAFGGSKSTQTTNAIVGGVHRDVDVLILYPMNLVAAEERFGSWMTQYAYANYITAEKLLEVGEITPDGKIEMAGRKFSTLVSLFDIVPTEGLLDFMDDFSSKGGKLMWFSAPPLIDGNGENCLDKWQNLFGVEYTPSVFFGEIAAGKEVVFQNEFKNIPQQTILTDFLVDRIYPVNLKSGSELLAKVDGRLVGAKKTNGKGDAYYFGFRPRDDQSQSLGYETRTLFEILNEANAYPSTGTFGGVNDNTEYVSRNSDYLTTKFPNGATVIVKHYRTHREGWADGFSRDDEADARVLANNPLPSDKVELKDFKVNGHTIDFVGKQTCSFNQDEKGNLISFEGLECNQVKINGVTYKLSDKIQNKIAWTTATEDEEDKYDALMKIWLDAEGKVSIPMYTDHSKIKFAKVEHGKKTTVDNVDYQVNNGTLQLDVQPELCGKWIYLVD
ncbi:MAG: hypothetical protein PVH88_00230 [Ignavibacteria bacterium]|jgi:hypothetical protein